MVEQRVRTGLKEYEETDGKSWEEELEKDERLKEPKREQPAGAGEKDEAYESSVQTVRDCKRAWWVAQPYVRPLPKEALAKGSLQLSKKEKARLEQRAQTADKESKVPHGHTEKENFGSSTTETIDVPKEGLVCG